MEKGTAKNIGTLHFQERKYSYKNFEAKHQVLIAPENFPFCDIGNSTNVLEYIRIWWKLWWFYFQGNWSAYRTSQATDISSEPCKVVPGTCAQGGLPEPWLPP